MLGGDALGSNPSAPAGDPSAASDDIAEHWEKMLETAMVALERDVNGMDTYCKLHSDATIRITR